MHRLVIAQPLCYMKLRTDSGLKCSATLKEKLERRRFWPSKTTSVHHLVPTPSLMIANVYRTDEVVGNARGGGYSTKAPFFVACSARKVTMPWRRAASCTPRVYTRSHLSLLVTVAYVLRRPWRIRGSEQRRCIAAVALVGSLVGRKRKRKRKKTEIRSDDRPARGQFAGNRVRWIRRHRGLERILKSPRWFRLPSVRSGCVKVRVKRRRG